MPAYTADSCSCDPWLLDLAQPDSPLHVSEGTEVSFSPGVSAMGCCCAGPLFFSAQGLPDGLSIDPSTGVISGTVPFQFADLANPDVTVRATVTVRQQDLCAGTTHTDSANYDFVVHNVNRPPTVTGVRIENLSRPGENPRTKDVLRLTVTGVSDPDGDPVTVRVQWRVNNTPVGSATEGTVSQFDLSQPGHGDVGDKVSAVIQLSDDGTVFIDAFTISVTVENSPPSIRGINVTGEQAYEGGIYYFVEGQRPRIRIRVQDDDFEQSPERERGLRVERADGQLPPGLEFEGGGYVNDNGEAIISGTIEPHGDADPTKYFQPRFRARDTRGAEDFSAFFQMGATDLKVTQFYFKDLPANHSSDNRIIIRVSATDVTRFTMVVRGVGAAADGTTLYWTVFEDDPVNDDELWYRRTVTVSSAQQDGSFTQEISFYLFADGSQAIAGPDDSSDEDKPDGIYGYIEKAGKWWGYTFLAQTSNGLWLEVIQ